MSLRFPTSHVLCTLQRSARTANQLLSLAITTSNLRSAIDPEDDFVSLNSKTFNFNENPSGLVDSTLISQLQQQNGSLQPTPYLLNRIITSCAKSASLDVGFEANVYIAVSLVTVYAKCYCSLKDFEKVCSAITRWDQISWNAAIAGFCNLGCGEQALKCFSEMRQTGIHIDYYTLTSVVGGIGVISGLKEGKQMHDLILKTGLMSQQSRGDFCPKYEAEEEEKWLIQA
ncbi:hypothetical protein ACOSP7_024912 [Xanthoceras sorbifolium]